MIDKDGASATEPAAERDWILHTPYAEPDQHWRLDEHGRATSETAPGRRPSSTQLPVPRAHGDQTDWLPPDDGIEPHGAINAIREHVRDWRDNYWPGVDPRVRRLLEHWAQESTGVPLRPFWCQRDAVETLIWLFDAGQTHAPAAHAAITARRAETDRRWNDGIPRVALKMATGTGKTNLMAMIALWWAVRHPDGPVHFLALTPGLTIRDRLEVLRTPDSELWKSVAPPEFQSDVKRMHWEIINFQAFQRKSTLTVGGKSATGKEKKLLLGPRRKRGSEPEMWRETDAEMLDRLLKAHRGGSPIAVFNDEAHHCYSLRDADLDKAIDRDEREARKEEKEERERAELWFNALRALRDHGRLSQVFDLSATPMWLRRPAALQAETFPWTVSDFSLIDAVESGLVKIPRVPVDDKAEENGQPVHLHPRYRNIYVHNDKKDLVEPLAAKVVEPLQQLYDHYTDHTLPAFEKEKYPPVMIVVANTIENATTLHRYIAGYRDGDVWRPGHLDLFSNVDPATGTPRAVPPTILVHSRLDDPADRQPAIAKAIADQSELFAPDAKTADDKRDAIRKVFMSVGREGEPGAAIRCVISVGMLTEGWDARNVTHVFGYRAFGSQLLCEQVAGRALRKIAFNGRDERQPVEYANLFGVPFAWLSGRANGPTPPPIEMRTVYTVPGREEFRLRFPHVAGYAPGSTPPRWEIDPATLAGRPVLSRKLVGSTVSGPLGGTIEVPTESQDGRTAIWNAAAQLVPKLDGGPDHRRSAFLDGLTIVTACLRCMRCDDWTDLQFDDETLNAIAAEVRRIDGDPFIAPVFADQQNRALPRTTDTSDVWFRTTLRFWYEGERSELNAAACHSQAEADLAEILERHPDIASWVRNFRLDWYVPWFDPTRTSWARMEPDFIAKAKEPTVDGRDRFLIIEFKGLKAGEPSEMAKEKYLEHYWAPAVSRPSADGEDHGEWRAVWIEHVDDAYRQIAEACRG